MMIYESSNDEDEEENFSSLSNNNDLKELCILLDEERQKMHELAEQWKQFGTNTIYKLESQILDYQEKLNELAQRQTYLVEENQSLKSLVDQMILQTNTNRNSISTQTNIGKSRRFHHSCCHRSKPIDDYLSRRTSTRSRQSSIDDPLQQQISIQNMFDAIKTAEVYESIDNLNGNHDDSEKKLLKEFCNLVWKYLEDRSKPKSSCLI